MVGKSIVIADVDNEHFGKVFTVTDTNVYGVEVEHSHIFFDYQYREIDIGYLKTIEEVEEQITTLVKNVRSELVKIDKLNFAKEEAERILKGVDETNNKADFFKGEEMYIYKFRKKKVGMNKQSRLGVECMKINNKGHVIKRTYAYTHPDDEFDYEIGCAIAYSKMRYGFILNGLLY